VIDARIDAPRFSEVQKYEWRGVSLFTLYTLRFKRFKLLASLN